MRRTTRLGQGGVTLIEGLTALVAVTVMTAIAIPMWRTHVLRMQRADGAAALTVIQAAQDEYFGRHARYANDRQLATPKPQGLAQQAHSPKGFYRLTIVTSGDGLGYTASAHAMAAVLRQKDERCTVLRVDHNGVRRASDARGEDQSATCWR